MTEALDPLAALVLGLVTLQRLGELAYARRNEARLLARGAIEAGAGHYPLVVALHAAWIGGLWIVALGTRPEPVWIAVFVALQALRFWVLMTLKERWTTRVLVILGEHLVARGPYRWLRHPNYVVVAAEIVVVPAAFGLWHYALAFGVANAAVLLHRIRVEDDALRRHAGRA